MKTQKQINYWLSLKERKGNKSPNWKGNKIGKSAIHSWLYSKYGSPKYCEHCKRTDRKIYEWANTNNHIYKRIRKHFIRLCRSCHRRYDLTPKKKIKAMKNLMWNNRVSKWSCKYKSCLICKKTKYKYRGSGLCTKCFHRYYNGQLSLTEVQLFLISLINSLK